MIKESIYYPRITVSTLAPLAPFLLAVAGTSYQVVNAGLITAPNSNKFSNVNGVITYTGEEDFTLMFMGNADVEVDTPCTITFYLYKNGVPVPGIYSPKTFLAPAKVGVLAKNHHVDIVKGDIFTVWAVSDTPNVNITIAAMALPYGR